MYNTCMDHTQLTYRDVESLTQDILRQMNKDSWIPDYVVGITRGGLLPAVLISQYLNVPMETLKVSLRDADCPPEHNTWMSEDAFGYNNMGRMIGSTPASDTTLRKNILIVDDINDSGATLNWIKQDWQESCRPFDEAWNDIWNNNVRFAVLIDNQASEYKRIDYSGLQINKLEDPRWVNFPYEDWWRK